LMDRLGMCFFGLFVRESDVAFGHIGVQLTAAGPILIAA